MFRSFLVMVLVGLVVWLIVRLVGSVKKILPDEPGKSSSAPLEDKKIIDAEFEDVEQEE